jgi:excinuclease ABC subunit B
MIDEDAGVTMAEFFLESPYSPGGDQPRAIEELVVGLNEGRKAQTLLGITGSGKSFTIANVIARTGRPALIMAHNKTLAGQLYEEFKAFFPKNAVEYFISYYDYYQPEAYIPSSDTFIEKDSSINEAIDRMRHAATRSLMERKDVIIVASVSCIYGLGTAEAYYGMILPLEVGQVIDRDAVLKKLVEIQYERNDIDFHRGTFRCRGDVVEVFPVHEDQAALRIEFFGDEVESIREIDPLRGKTLRTLDKVAVYPGSHYVVGPAQLQRAIDTIKTELNGRLAQLRSMNRLLEAQRLEQRTQHDLEMLVTQGYCNGIENYSRHLTGREPGQAPPCLLDYFGPDWLMVMDESHQTVPQVGAMYRGDRSRKETLVEHGFRLPSAMDNRPLMFGEFERKLQQVIHVSATPGDYELNQCEGVVTEQIIRPTGLLDPEIEVRPALNQVDDVYGEIRARVEEGDRVLVTTLTKRMSEDLTEYLQDMGVKAKYLHSDIDTLERAALLRDLRLGLFDVLVGINLLREGLDLPEVSLVAILDADKEGFLRSERSLIQTVGRAARNVKGKVLMYADRVTDSMRACIDETYRRRAIQIAHNLAHGITPQSAKRDIRDLEAHIPPDPGLAPSADLGALHPALDPSALGPAEGGEVSVAAPAPLTQDELDKLVGELTRRMKEHAKNLEFEKAAELRDKVRLLQARQLGLG